MAAAVKFGFDFTEEAYKNLVVVEMELARYSNGGASLEFLENCAIAEIFNFRDALHSIIKRENSK